MRSLFISVVAVLCAGTHIRNAAYPVSAAERRRP